MAKEAQCEGLRMFERLRGATASIGRYLHKSVGSASFGPPRCLDAFSLGLSGIFVLRAGETTHRKHNCSALCLVSSGAFFGLAPRDTDTSRHTCFGSAVGR